MYIISRCGMATLAAVVAVHDAAAMKANCTIPPLVGRAYVADDRFIVAMIFDTAKVTSAATAARPEFAPKTELARILWEAQQEILESGEPLYSTEEIFELIAKARS